MCTHRKTIVRLLLVMLLCFSPVLVNAAAAADGLQKKQTSPVAMTLDLLLCRPLGMVATLTGGAVFVVSAPFSALGGNIGDAWDSLVVTPAQYTFSRPLGEFDK